MAQEAVIEQHYQEAVKKYTGIQRPCLVNDIWVMTGKIPVIDQTGYHWDTYDVKIILPVSYPSEIPLLIETSHKIERHIDWHIDKRGVCCLAPDARQYRQLSDGITLLRWIDRLVIPYLANHIRKKELGSYANGEFAHGASGILEYYADLLQTTDLLSLIRCLQFMAGSTTYSKNVDCFCGSSKKFKRCYEKGFHDRRLGIPKKVLLHDIKQLEKLRTLTIAS